MHLLHFVCLSVEHADRSLMEPALVAHARENPKAKYAFSKINEWISSLVGFHCVVKSQTAVVLLCFVLKMRARLIAIHITDSRRWMRWGIALCELRALRERTRTSSKRCNITIFYIDYGINDFFNGTRHSSTCECRHASASSMTGLAYHNTSTDPQN